MYDLVCKLLRRDPATGDAADRPAAVSLTAPTAGAGRLEYTRGALSREDLRDDPIDQFADWFAQACRAGAGIPQADAMSLATVSDAGEPSIRTVLMKAYDRRGFVFFTNLQSRKSRDIAGNPRVALLFPWLALERQVVINGPAERISTAEVLKYFITRPRGSQLSAWASAQGGVVASRKVLEIEWARLSRKFADGEVPLPSFWGGFRVRPDRIEFWQGRANRLHDRFVYTRGGGRESEWKIDRLAP